jgi:prophage antirepressor-like protein
MDIKIENWNGHEIRFVQKDLNEWWAVLADVAKALSISRHGLAQRLSKGLISTEPLTTVGGTQEMLVIDEDGIYASILESRKPEAKEFKRWAISVIKELRKATGLEAWQAFLMTDKERQKDAMKILKDCIPKPLAKHYIKANSIANKAVSLMFGCDYLQKGEMHEEMKAARQPILREAAELTAIKEKYGLDISVSKTIYKKFGVA